MEIKIYQHPDPQTTLLPLLRAHLPHSIPVLRRIQHGLAYPTPSGTVLATFPPDAAPSPTAPEPSTWLAAYVDLFRGRETQIYLYASLEREASSPAPRAGDFVSTFADRSSVEKQAETRAQLLAFLAHVKATLLPAYLSSSVHASQEDEKDHPAPGGEGHDETSPFASLTPRKVPPPPPTAFLFGSLHTGLLTLLTASRTAYSDPDALPGVKIVRRDDPPYVKYLFRPEVYRTAAADAEHHHSLPPGYRFHDRRGRFGILPHHHALVSSRTHIPRSSLTLSRMPGVAVYYDGDTSHRESPDEAEKEEEEEMPIAWAFLGYDGSLATLHVEPEHRGRGIGMQVSREAIRAGLRPGGIFRAAEGEKGEDELGHTDVLMTNRSSRRVMEKLGGEMAWTDTWAVVELL
ncbi:hypothetical protein VTN02DRAFT_142 [Thermoascus thermophilus]